MQNSGFTNTFLSYLNGSNNLSKYLHRVLEFNKFDLYTKEDETDITLGDSAIKSKGGIDIEELWTYYTVLLKKYNLDGELDW